jgi:dTDP-4-amino-4,6-dideoxygalactose transaminase
LIANLTIFEQNLESYLGAGHMCFKFWDSSYSSGLIILGLNRDEVICQSMTFRLSANPILYLGATCFIDSEPETWNLCPVA